MATLQASRAGGKRSIPQVASQHQKRTVGGEGEIQMIAARATQSLVGL